MAYQAQWGNKSFVISPSKIVPLLNLTTGFTKKETDSEDTSGQPTTNTRGVDLQEITLETRYVAGTGADPRGQIDDWYRQFGQKHPLYINGQRFGPKLLELQDVQFSNIVLDNAGRFLQVDASIRLKEYIPPTTTVSAKKAAQTGAAAEGGNAVHDGQAEQKNHHTLIRQHQAGYRESRGDIVAKEALGNAGTQQRRQGGMRAESAHDNPRRSPI